MTDKIDVKIGTKEESFWTSVKKKCEEMIKQCEHEKTIQEHILKLTALKIEEESKK